MVHKHGGDIYSYGKVRDFSANINFRGMPESVKMAAVKAVEDSVHYPDPEYRTLRKKLAYRETQMTGADVTPEDVICGNGAAELMFSMAAALRPKKAFLAVPSFFEYEQSLSAFGCDICRFLMKEENGFLLEEDFLQAVPENTDLIILGNPNNPTGRLVESDFLRKLLRLCRDRDIFLILDESFLDFLTDEDRKRTLEGSREIRQNSRLMVIRSFTKMYGMPGLRFGYGLCSDTVLLEKMREGMQPWNVSVPAQAAAEAAAMELAFARQTAEETRRNREEMVSRMVQAGYRVFPSDTNFLLFQGPVNLQKSCLKEGFLIRDCSNFPGLKDGYFRICVRSLKENAELLEVLKRLNT